MKKGILFLVFQSLIIVLNAQVSRTVNITTAGTLSTRLTLDEQSVITHLTITGSINDEDFRTMKNFNMPVLEVININGASIVGNVVPETALSGKKTLKSIMLPSSITSIEFAAFSECTALTSVNIPASVTTIKRHAFSYCTDLATVTIPESVIEIGDYAFFNCIHLSNIFIPSSVTSIGSMAFGNCKSFTSVIIPSSVTFIGDFIFTSCTSLKSITIPISVDSIPKGLCDHCDSLTSINIPSSVTSIGDNAFSNCISLKSIDIPPTVTSIGALAFFYCDSLSSFIIHPSITSIGNNAFNGCSSLTSIYAYPPDPLNVILGSNIFEWETTIKCTLFVSHNSKELYKTADQWNRFINIVALNKTPVANASFDQTVDEGTLVTLDATGSKDDDGDILTYLWTAPEGIILSSNTESTPKFLAPEVTKDTLFLFTLSVYDGFDSSISDTVIVTVKQVDKVPYIKAFIENISVEKDSQDKIINLYSIFYDDDIKDALSFVITSNSNNNIVSLRIEGGNLILSFSSTNTGTSNIVVTATSNGKSVQTSFIVEVTAPTINEPYLNNSGINVYPNPADSFLYISFPCQSNGSYWIELNSISGQKCYSNKFTSESIKNIFTIDIQNYQSGTYLLKVKSNNNTFTKVIILK